LFEELVKNGLVVSEYPPEVAPLPYFFPVRNRIMAGLSKAVLIVNGGLKSGTIYTAEFAMEYGKEVFAIPYTPNVESGLGNNNLIKSGAILTDSFKDIADYLKIDIKEEIEIELSPEEQKIVELLKDGSVHTDIICQKLSKQIYEITPILSALEIKGVIVKSGFNTYAKI
jgi:DNA processing protein